MNLLKRTGFLLKSLYLRTFHRLNVRGGFRIFSNLLVSFHAFTGSFGKTVGRNQALTNQIVAQKTHTVKQASIKNLRSKPEVADHKKRLRYHNRPLSRCFYK